VEELFFAMHFTHVEWKGDLSFSGGSVRPLFKKTTLTFKVKDMPLKERKELLSPLFPKKESHRKIDYL